MPHQAKRELSEYTVERDLASEDGILGDTLSDTSQLVASIGAHVLMEILVAGSRMCSVAATVYSRQPDIALSYTA